MNNTKQNYFLQNEEDVWNILDSDGDGYITKDELYSNKSKLAATFSDEVVDVILKEADSDNDNRISREEFVNFTKKINKKLRDLFNIIDTKKIGYLTKEQLKKSFSYFEYEITNRQLDAIVEKLDIDKDDKISYLEFIKYHHIIPLDNIRSLFDQMASDAIDLGESIKIPQTSTQVSPIITLLAGGISGAISRTCTAPFDRVKIMMQASNEKVSVLQTVNQIRKQGMLAFFKGNGSNVFKIIPETAIQFFAYDTIKSFTCKDIKNPTTFERLKSGALAGVTAQSCIYPLEITRTRLALSQDKSKYKGIFHCMRTIVKEEGFFALYKGWTASIYGIIPYASTNLALYNTFKARFTKDSHSKPSTLTILSCGASAGMIAQFVAYPFAIIRTKLQSQGMMNTKVQYKGFSDAGIQMFKNEGIRGFYKGLLPNYMKSIPAVSISFAVFEKAKDFLCENTNF